MIVVCRRALAGWALEDLDCRTDGDGLSQLCVFGCPPHRPSKIMAVTCAKRDKHTQGQGWWSSCTPNEGHLEERRCVSASVRRTGVCLPWNRCIQRACSTWGQASGWHPGVWWSTRPPMVGYSRLATAAVFVFLGTTRWTPWFFNVQFRVVSRRPLGDMLYLLLQNRRVSLSCG